MNFKDAVSKLGTDLDAILAPAMVEKPMTQEEFFAYAQAEVAKAKEEKEKDPTKAKKRLEHLRLNVALIEKYNWDGDNGTPLIPVYKDPGQLTPTEMEVDIIGAMRGAQASNSGNGITDPRGATNFAKAMDGIVASLNAPAGEAAPKPEVKSEKTADTFVWPADCSDREFMKEGIAKRGADWGVDGSPAK